MIRRTVSTRTLPADTKQHLHNMIVNGAGGTSEPFNQNPDGIVGRTTKYAWRPGLAAGGAGAGKCRLLKHVHADNRVYWFVAEHSGANTYLFDALILPICATCNGTTTMICPQCNGLNERDGGAVKDFPGFRDRRECLLCNGTRVQRCRTCKSATGSQPLIINGKSISRDIANW